MRKAIMDDGFQSYLTEGATFIGEPGIPCLLNLNNTEAPKSLVAFDRSKYAKNHRQYVHFYIHDYRFYSLLSSTKKYLDLLKMFDGVISPDPTILIGRSRCLQETNTYFNRAVAYYLQKNGIPVIPNVRWGEESTFDFAFLGIPKHQIVAVSTHGCMMGDTTTKNLVRDCFVKGLPVMLDRLEPKQVIVYGHMPETVFGPYLGKTNFVRYPSEIEIFYRRKAGK